MSQLSPVLGGYHEWRNESGKYHRTDGPAVEFASGTKHWYINGVSHRTGGPAIIRAAVGVEIWCEEGRYHRIGGPAITQQHNNTTILEWWIEGIQFEFEDYKEILVRTFDHTQADVDDIEVIMKLQYGAITGITT